MKYAELQALVPAWKRQAETTIWYPDRSDGRHPSFNTCRESSRIILDSLYTNHYLEPDLMSGILRTDDPNTLDLSSHFWPEVQVEDRDEWVIVDLTLAQTGHVELPWAAHTPTELAARGLHYVARTSVPYFY